MIEAYRLYRSGSPHANRPSVRPYRGSGRRPAEYRAMAGREALKVLIEP